jgi:hypothetical protein
MVHIREEFRRVYHIIKCRRRGVHVGYWRESQKERDHWEEKDVGGEKC